MCQPFSAAAPGRADPHENDRASDRVADKKTAPAGTAGAVADWASKWELISLRAALWSGLAPAGALASFAYKTLQRSIATAALLSLLRITQP
jgi:hypothetical protein